MQKMCNAKHRLLHMGENVCLCSVCCPRSSGSKVGEKKKQDRSHSWGLGIEYMASFSQLKKIMLRRAENLAGVLSFF